MNTKYTVKQIKEMMRTVEYDIDTIGVNAYYINVSSDLFTGKNMCKLLDLLYKVCTVEENTYGVEVFKYPGLTITVDCIGAEF